jgi:hypothetical protein|tara:strand:+ start:152 stop:418 length:267 start_codon:yes stop_codon:yes gene_type:complete
MNWKDIVKKDKVKYMTPEQEKEYQKLVFDREKREYEERAKDDKARFKAMDERIARDRANTPDGMREAYMSSGAYDLEQEAKRKKEKNS